jgi:putative copper resistance protein D
MDNYLFLPRAAAAALYDLSFAAATGLTLCLLWLPAGTAHLHRRLRRALLSASILTVCALTAQLWLITATMIGAATPHDVLPQLHDVLTATHAGRIASAAILPALLLLTLSAIAAAQASKLDTTRSPQRLLKTSLATVVILAILRSATGHAAAQGDFNLDEAVQLLHLAATALWAGLILAAGLLIAPRLRNATDAVTLTHLGRRISAAATLAIGVVILSGLYNAWRGLGGVHLHPLVNTQWGVLLTTKSALVSAALLVGLYNRLLLRRNPELTPADAARFTRSLCLEACIMLAILTLSAFLANSMPANMPM